MRLASFVVRSLLDTAEMLVSAKGLRPLNNFVTGLHGRRLHEMAFVDPAIVYHAGAFA